MSLEIVQKWLQEAADTLFDKNLEAHLNLISKNVSLTGIEGYENIDYSGWSAQCEHEFKDNIVNNVDYSGILILSQSEASIKFKTFETIEANDGKINSSGIEVQLAKEDDGVWRVIRERVLTDMESRKDGLIK